MNEVESIAWAAGFLDGEGCFGLHKRADVKDLSSREPRISASQRKREPLDRLESIFGGRVGETMSGGRPCYQWSITGAKNVKEVILLLEPFLCNKKQEAIVVASYCETVYRRGRVPMPPDEVETRLFIIDQFREARLV